MPAMTPEQRDAFLAEPRVAIISTNGTDGPPLSVPVWFEWDGTRARLFTGAGSPKLRRIARDPAIALLVANPTGQPEAWVLLQGPATVSDEGAFDLAERLAHRYWDMADPAHVETVEGWRAAAPTLRVVELAPTRIRSSA
jgi:PPOX class probable F420-dependent enzyme